MDQMSRPDELREARPVAPSKRHGLLPPDTPLDMPTQPLHLPAAARNAGDRVTWSRALLLVLAGIAVAAFANLLYEVLSVVQLTVLQGVFLVLCTMCFAWIALGTSSAVLGFMTMRRARNAAELDAAPVQGVRTALLFPVYQEDTARIAATIECIARELVALGADKRFDIFVLSDSRLGDIKARELRAVRFLRRRLRDASPIYYRCRTQNVGKKAGNIADWVQRFGGAYESFIILDADSIMSGGLLAHLQSLMAARPKAGLIQTVPRLVGADTLFARLQQFAVALYGPVVATGFAAWYQHSGNYWGHNAIVRTRAFAGAAGLPNLPGRPPLGGHVLSHDFVEAAFLRRAGWQVSMRPDLLGSYEGCPPTLIDVAVRDRRWAQGNVQHLRIVGTRGLPWVSRLHLGMGAYAYFSSVLWTLSLLVGVILSLQSAYTLPVYFPDAKTLFPVWPVIDPTKAFYLFLVTLAVLLLPKIFGIAAAMLRTAVDAPRPGVARLLAGSLVEMLFSILMAPILMLTQTKAIFEILTGKDSGWSAQRRDGDAHEWSSLLQFHGGHLAVGIVLTIVCLLASVYVAAWMGPIIAGLLLSVAISHVTSKTAPGWLAKILATPEDLQPPAIVAAVGAVYPEWRSLLARNRPLALTA
jgi:membrane glycosyltransferase